MSQLRGPLDCIRNFHKSAFLVFGFLSTLVVAGRAIEGDGSPSHSGILSFGLENDFLVGNDSHYTSGLSVGWTTADLRETSRRNFFHRLMRLGYFLPPFRDSALAKHVNIALVQEIYTPIDISTPIPPSDDQPYVGVLMADLTWIARGRFAQHDMTFSGGVAGPAAGAAWVQEQFHKAIDAEVPQGWAEQIPNEPVINLGYHYHRRLRPSQDDGRLDFDISASGGAALGNYLTGADLGLLFRWGVALPNSYGSFGIRRGASGFAGLETDIKTIRCYFFAECKGFGVARFLPMDRSTFGDGPSVDRETLFASLSSGFVFGYRRLLTTTSFNMSSESGFPRNNNDNFGGITFSYIY